MRKTLWVLCAVVMLSTCMAGLSACDKSIPQFEGDPVSMTGSLRWEGEWVYLDVVVTNNTNNGIMNIRTSGETVRQVDYSEEWRQASNYSPNVGKFSSNWLDNLKKAPIEANSSQTFSDKIGSSADNSGAYISYSTAYKCVFYITQIDFKGYGVMTFDSGQMEFNFEGYMN